MDLHRYELATHWPRPDAGAPATARWHGKVLREKFHDAATVRAIVTDPDNAGLDPVDVAVLAFADRVAAEPAAITAADIAALHDHGLSDLPDRAGRGRALLLQHPAGRHRHPNPTLLGYRPASPSHRVGVG